MQDLIQKYNDAKDALAEIEAAIRAERVKMEGQISDIDGIIGAPKRRRRAKRAAKAAALDEAAPVKRGPGRPRKIKTE